jgi:hypothetical protein
MKEKAEQSSSKITPGIKSKYLVISLIILPIVFFTLRYFLGPTLTSSDQLWSVSISVKYQGTKNTTIVKLATPARTEHSRTYNQTVSHDGSTISYQKKKYSRHSYLNFLAESDEPLEIDSEFLIKISEHPEFNFRRTLLLTNAIEHYLADKPELDITNNDLVTLAENMKQVSIDDARTIEAIFNYAKSFKTLSNSEEQRPVSAILKKKKSLRWREPISWLRFYVLQKFRPAW